MLNKDEINFCIGILEESIWNKKTKVRKLERHIEVLEARNKIKEEDSLEVILQEAALVSQCTEDINEIKFIIKKLKKELK